MLLRRTVLPPAPALHCGAIRMLSRVTVASTPQDQVYTNDAIKEMIRIDHAGETAAVRICRAQQWWVSPLDTSREVIDEIVEEEEYHFATMQKLATKYDVPVSVADPLFYVATGALGLGTAVLGKHAIMACHEAVETSITAHYNEQLRDLYRMKSGDKAETFDGDETKMKQRDDTVDELSTIISRFRDDEEHHRELGAQNGAAQAPGYAVLFPAIQAACAVGIEIAKRT